MSLDRIGTWPVDGREVRKTGEFVKITQENMLRTIHGDTHPIPFNFFVSNDYCHMGEFLVPVGGEGVRASEPISHKGDATVYVESGPITFFFPDTYETFIVEEGEVMYIPENHRYQCINYTGKIVKGIFSVSPGI
ncbi:MAG TPA: hypothetical protein VN381_11180 [Anaerovoracaceae bacterium]|nr:hypothetical protein [Anaerovoracaceae bacterium]